MLNVRRLYLVPIIHAGADMGSIAPALEERTVSELGQEMWRQHIETLSRFWDSIAQCLASLKVDGYKVYQDGLVASGEAALRIVSRGAEEGSRNYQIILRLVRAGATLLKTEDASLVKKEYDLITEMARARSARQREVATLRYQRARASLLEQRDNFIAMKIEETLEENDTGILFIGAYHRVLPRLARDIQVVQVKELAKVREYHQALVSKRTDKQYLRRLADYLVAPVSCESLING